MRRALALVGLAAFGVVGFGLAVAAGDAQEPPNQGDPDKVLTVASGFECTGTLVAGEKVEGGLGPTITVSATAPIVQVTIKSGSKAELVSATWAADWLSGTITISQDVSNYVVWTCSGDTTTTGTTTTETTTETTTTETTTTETTTTETGTTETTTTETGTTETTTTEAPTVPLTPPGLPEEEAEEEAAEAPTGAGAEAAGGEADTPAAPLAPPQLAYTP